MAGRILIAEDVEDLRELVRQILVEAGFTVHPLARGDLILPYLASAPRDAFPDLLLSDVFMPGLSGLDLLRETKARWPDLPVVLMTAHGDTEVLREALKQSCDGYLDKPFRVQELLHEVERVLAARARLRQSLAEPPTRSLASLPQGSEPTPAQGVASGGRCLGKYELLDEIARGASGVVYRARQTDLDRLVALKVVPREARGRRSTDVVKREARAMASLHHPHIAVVYDMGREGELEYLSMEYVEGASLAAVLRQRGSLGVDEALGVVGPIADGLAHAHELGIFHHDIKPGNIVIASSGRAVLVDFGIAIRAGEDGRSDADYLAGTLQYLPPEYAAGGPYDQRGELYALAVVLYEALAGRGRFPYWSDETTVRGVEALLEVFRRGEAIPLRRWRRDVDRELEATLARATLLAPEARQGSLRELADELRAHAHSDSQAWRLLRD